LPKEKLRFAAKKQKIIAKQKEINLTNCCIDIILSDRGKGRIGRTFLLH
jgi:hypothetical protein